MTGSPLLRRAAGIAWLLALVALAVGSQRVLAADSSAAPSEQACPDPLIAWFDHQLPPDAAAGRQIPIGVTVWDCTRDGLAGAESAELRVHPKSGKDVPASFPSRSDWTGHLTATIEVPKGGVGAIDVGFTGQECHDDGTCKEAFFPFAHGGFGPPPDAPRAVLVTARIAVQPDPIVAGHAFGVDIDVEPKADWDPAVVLPDAVVVEALVARGATSYRTDVRAVPGDAGHYAGQVAIADSGDVVLHALLPGDGGPDEMIDGAITRITIEPDDGSAHSPAAPPGATAASPDAPTIPILPLAGVLALGAVALVVQRVFADL